MAGREDLSDPNRPRRRRVKRTRPDTDNRTDDEDDPVQTMIPYKNARALSAYYFGVFSLSPLIGLLLAPIAFFLGILGYRYGQTHPTAKGSGHAVAGIVFGIAGTLLNLVLCAALAAYVMRLGPFAKK